MNIDDIAPFPNPGVNLLKEDEHVAIWEEVFVPGVPTPPHRHLRDYIAIFPDGGELTVTHVAGELESYSIIAGKIEPLPNNSGGYRVGISANAMLHSSVPHVGAGHIAVNEGDVPVRMILIELKGSSSEKP